MNITYNLYIYITNVISSKTLFRFGEFSNDHHLPGFLFVVWFMGLPRPRKMGNVSPGDDRQCVTLQRCRGTLLEYLEAPMLGSIGVGDVGFGTRQNAHGCV